LAVKFLEWKTKSKIDFWLIGQGLAG